MVISNQKARTSQLLKYFCKKNSSFELLEYHFLQFYMDDCFRYQRREREESPHRY